MILMNKKGFLSTRNLTMLFPAILIIGVLIFVVLILSENKDYLEDCQDQGVPRYICNSGGMECYQGCGSLGKEYFKYDSGGFASPECYCLDNGEVDKIW